MDIKLTNILMLSYRARSSFSAYFLLCSVNLYFGCILFPLQTIFNTPSKDNNLWKFVL